MLNEADAGSSRAAKRALRQVGEAMGCLRTEDQVICLIAVSNNFLVTRAAYEAAVKYNPRERWLLRDGIRVVERYEP